MYLGLSIADRDLITTTLTGTAGATALAECYHLTADESVAVLEDVDRFLRATGMTGLELQELLYQSLSTTALDPAGRPERTRASEFFIHQGGTCVTLEADEQKLIWGDGSAPVPFAWFELVNRFVRLARKVSLSFTDLDLVLRSCCASPARPGRPRHDRGRHPSLRRAPASRRRRVQSAGPAGHPGHRR